MKEKNMITKKDIETIKDEIFAFAKKHELGNDFSVFCNNNLYHYKLDENYEYKYEEVEEVNPLDYCEYFPEKFLIGLAYDGTFYEFMNEVNPWMVKADEEFMELLKKHGMWLEHCDSCHAAIYYDGDDEVEYMNYKKEKIKYVFRADEAPDEIFGKIMELWYALSKEVGDEGSCVLGAYLEMDYKGQKYRVYPQSPWQGSLSWERPLEVIKSGYALIGATGLYYNPGHLD